MQQSNSFEVDDDLSPPVREFVKPTSLNGLLHALCMIDEAMLELDFNQQIDLIENGKVKVDNYKFLIDKMKLLADGFRKKKAEYAAALSTMENNIESLENHMVYALQSNKFNEFTGNEYKAKLRFSEYVELKHSEPGDHHAILFSDYIKVTREWKKLEFKKALKRENPDAKLMELASLEKRASVHFSVIKDI